MNGETFRIDTVIDRQKLIPALIDNGSEAYASVNDNLVRRLGLPRIQIPKRPLEGVCNRVQQSCREATDGMQDILLLEVQGVPRSCIRHLGGL